VSYASRAAAPACFVTALRASTTTGVGDRRVRRQLGDGRIELPTQLALDERHVLAVRRIATLVE